MYHDRLDRLTKWLQWADPGSSGAPMQQSPDQGVDNLIVMSNPFLEIPHTVEIFPRRSAATAAAAAVAAQAAPAEAAPLAAAQMQRRKPRGSPQSWRLGHASTGTHCRAPKRKAEDVVTFEHAFNSLCLPRMWRATSSTSRTSCR